MNIIHDDDSVKIFYEKGEGNNTLVSFSGVDFDVFGFDNFKKENIDRPEFVKVTEGMGDRFWVIDKNRTWGCHIDWEWLTSFLSPRFDGKNVVALGNCMGATNAIKFAYYADVHRVIAFTPHWSVDPDIMFDHTFDKRTQHLVSRANETGWKSLEGMFRPMTTYIHFWTPDPIDIPFMIKFPVLPNIKVFTLVNSSHSVARFIKSQGVLPKVLGQCIVAEDPHRAVSEILDSVGLNHELF